jgi:hypothetical protein
MADITDTSSGKWRLGPAVTRCFFVLKAFAAEVFLAELASAGKDRSAFSPRGA